MVTFSKSGTMWSGGALIKKRDSEIYRELAVGFCGHSVNRGKQRTGVGYDHSGFNVKLYWQL